MTILDVISTMPINENTAVIVKGNGKELKNGIGILDSCGKPYMVISVGMSSSRVSAREATTPLLVEGHFTSDKIFV